MNGGATVDWHPFWVMVQAVSFVALCVAFVLLVLVFTVTVSRYIQFLRRMK